MILFACVFDCVALPAKLDETAVGVGVGAREGALVVGGGAAGSRLGDGRALARRRSNTPAVCAREKSKQNKTRRGQGGHIAKEREDDGGQDGDG